VLGPDLEDPPAAEAVEATRAAQVLEDDSLARLGDPLRVGDPPPERPGLDVEAPDAGAEAAGLRVQGASIAPAPLAFRS